LGASKKVKKRKGKGEKVKKEFIARGELQRGTLRAPYWQPLDNHLTTT